jgi:DNA (cytosine-5)-methyltransferase 1
MKNVYEPINQSLALGTGGIESPVKGQACMGVMTTSSIRRLTPLECERLQGFPDLWTCLCEASSDRDWTVMRVSDEQALRCRCPDGPRYRAMGNAVSVPVIFWLGQRLQRQWQ